MTEPLATSVDPDLAAHARATVDSIIARRVSRMIDHPCHAIRQLQVFGLDGLEPPALAARAEALLEREYRRPKGCFELGRAFDLRTIADYARHLTRELETA